MFFGSATFHRPPGNTTSLPETVRLQAQLRAGIVVEERTFADIPPHHLHGAVAGLAHDRRFACAVAAGGGRVSGAQGVAGEISGLEADALGGPRRDDAQSC